MYTKIYGVVVATLFSISLFGQQTSLELTVDDIEFDNAAEKEVFTQLTNNTKVDYFTLFFYSGNQYNTQTIETARNRINTFAQNFINKKFEKKSPQKKIKALYNKTHDEFFSKYELENHYKSVFENGGFNCVSGTATFAFLFDITGIPYQIKELPRHVYLEAYPTTEKIKVEATDPQNGYVVYTEAFKKEYVKYLKDNKLISADEYNTTPTNQLFDENFGSDSSINLRQLVGLQYLNEAIYAMEDEDVDAAIVKAQKAYLLFPSDVIGYTLLVYLANYLDHKSNYNTLKDLKYTELITRYSIIKDDEERAKSVLSVIEGVWEKNVANNSNPSFYDSACNYFQTHIQDSGIRSKMLFYCEYKKAQHYITEENYFAALPHLKAAYLANKEDKDVKLSYYATLITTYEKLPLKTVINNFDSLVNYDSTLVNLKMFNNTYLNTLLYAADDEFLFGKPTKGFEYIDQFENAYAHKPVFDIDEDFVNRAYASAGIYYFKRNQKAKAKEYFERGLKYSPNSRELQHRLRSL
jgi:hypothetical protein